MSSPAYQRIYAAVREIPRGRVATYGQIARLAACSGPRQVGYALHSLPEGARVPWHRVINAKGEISLPKGSESAEMQRLRLESEGVTFGPGRKIQLNQFAWRPSSGI